MVSAVKKALDIPLIVGGGIRDANTAEAKIRAGAAVVVTGTIAEDDKSKLAEIIKAVTKPECVS
jgi:heptaprenylglyceryl phosphate synthase